MLRRLNAALNQLDTIRTDAPESGNGNSAGGKSSRGNGSGASADVNRSIERQIDGVLEQLRLSKRADI